MHLAAHGAHPLNASWAAMGRSLGASSTAAEDAALAALLSKFRGRSLLLIGDSSLRNQFMQLLRVGLSLDRSVPVAQSAVGHAYSGSLSLPNQIVRADKPDSSNAFWGGFSWLAFSTPANATLYYAKVWGCAKLSSVIRRMRPVAHRHSQRSGGLGGWPPHAVLWNFGLHLLHVYPARPVATAAVQCAQHYEELVDASARALRHALPRALLYYRTTNAVCDARFEGSWAVAARAYHCANPGPWMAKRCLAEERLTRVQSACRSRYNFSLLECSSTFMDEANTRAQRLRARRTLREHPAQVQIFDAFAVTERRCEATVDGRHYPRLLATLNQKWLAQVTEALVAP